MTRLSDEQIVARARQLEWLLLDVDGVLTDGRLTYGPEGERDKVFHVRDGLGLRLARRSGLKVGILSGRASEALRVRAAELEVDWLMMDRADKGVVFPQFVFEHDLLPAQVAYVGDDLVDLPVLLRCGLSFAPADAVREVRERVHLVLRQTGGNGAVREVCELLVKARGQWDELIAPYFHVGEPD